MDLRINELSSTIQSTAPQGDVAKIVRGVLQVLMDEKDRERRAEAERNLSASIRSPKP